MFDHLRVSSYPFQQVHMAVHTCAYIHLQTHKDTYTYTCAQTKRATPWQRMCFVIKKKLFFYFKKNRTCHCRFTNRAARLLGRWNRHTHTHTHTHTQTHRHLRCRLRSWHPHTHTHTPPHTHTHTRTHFHTLICRIRALPSVESGELRRGGGEGGGLYGGMCVFVCLWVSVCVCLWVSVCVCLWVSVCVCVDVDVWT